jgi:hypothetical protein
VAVSGDYNTSQVTENTNLYFTNARAIASTLTGYTSGAGTITSSDSILSAIQKLNGNIGALTTGVSSVNGLTGAVTLTTSNIAEGTNLYYTEARVNANTNVAANTAARHNAVTIGTANGLSLSTQVLSLGLASTSTTGALSSTDWNTFNNKTSNTGTVTSVGLSSATSGVTIGSTPITTSGTITLAIATASGSQQGLLSSADWTTFNNKQSALTNPVTGSGTNNYIAKFTSTGSIIGNSIISEGSNVINVNGDITVPVFYSVKFGGSSATAYMGDFNNDGSIQFATSSSTKMRLNASGNLGLGVTPSAWFSGTKALQINGGSMYAANTYTFVGSNIVYTDAGDKYINTGFATVYGQLSGEHRWYNAPSGTAGNAISFTQAMTLNASGNLGLGTTSPSTFGKLAVSVSGTGSKAGIGISNGGYNGTISSPTEIGLLELFSAGGTAPTGIYGINSYNDNSASWLSFKTTNGAGTTSTAMTITSGGNVEINTGSIKTGEPDTGYGRAAFKIGSRQSGSATGTGGYIPISIDGTVYFINLYTSTP